MSGEFASGTVMWFWYKTFLVVPAAAAVVYLTVRSILWFPWTRRIELDDGERKRVLHTPALAVKLLSVAGAALVVLAALDRSTVELLSMNANAFGYASLIGAVFAAVFGLFAVIRARMTRGREEEDEDEEQAPEEAPQDVGIPGATQVFTRVRGAEAWLVTRSGDDSGSIIQMQGDNVSVGSEEGSGIRIGNETVDANHALIKVNQGHYSLFDLGSSNGTWINDNQVIGAVLRDGSRIAMGNSELFFTEVGGGSAVSDEEWRAAGEQGRAAGPTGAIAWQELPARRRRLDRRTPTRRRRSSNRRPLR